MTATLTAGIRVSGASLLRSPRVRRALRRTIYAPIDEHRTAASNDDVAAAWVVVAGLIGLASLIALSL